MLTVPLRKGNEYNVWQSNKNGSTEEMGEVFVLLMSLVSPLL